MVYFDLINQNPCHVASVTDMKNTHDCTLHNVHCTYLSWFCSPHSATEFDSQRKSRQQQDQIELERSASCQWERGKGDIDVGSMSGRGCVVWRGKMELKKKEQERERILILNPNR